MKVPSLSVPLFLIIFGSLWLLKTLAWLPDSSTIIAAILVAAGVLVFVLDGINKQSVISAPLLMYIGGVIYAVDAYGYAAKPLIAFGMILLGCLMLIARSDAVPPKRPKSES